MNQTQKRTACFVKRFLAAGEDILDDETFERAVLKAKAAAIGASLSSPSRALSLMHARARTCKAAAIGASLSSLLSLARSLALARSLSLSLSRARALSLSFSLSFSLFLSFSLSLFLSLSLFFSQARMHTHIQSYSYGCLPSLFLAPSSLRMTHTTRQRSGRGTWRNRAHARTRTSEQLTTRCREAHQAARG